MLNLFFFILDHMQATHMAEHQLIDVSQLILYLAQKF